MEAVAKAMGKNVLREVEYEEFFQSLDVLKEKVNDRALLRAFHFFGENERVDKAVSSLENNDFDSFKQAITESGYSSFLYNQNVYSPKNPTEQKLSLALCISEKLLTARAHGEFTAADLQALFRRLFQMICLMHIKKQLIVFLATAHAMCLL